MVFNRGNRPFFRNEVSSGVQHTNQFGVDVAVDRLLGYVEQKAVVPAAAGADLVGVQPLFAVIED